MKLSAISLKNSQTHFVSISLATWKRIQEAHLLMIASSLAFTTLLSLVPLLAVSFAIFQAFGGMQKLYAVVEPMILANLAQGTSEEVISSLHRFINNTHAGAIGIGGLIGLIATSMSMLWSAEKAIQHVWKTRMTRSFFQRIAYYWLLITLGPLALSIAVGAATSSHIPLARFFPSGTGLFITSIGIFFCVYKWVPHAVVKWQYALVSSFFTAVMWNFARLGFALYTKNVVSYDKIYGSLGAIPVLMLWIYIVWIIILSGAALTAVLQGRT